MAYQGLNVEGAPLVRVMPQYTPVNTALDLSGIGRGIEQGMGLVNNAVQMRRARDLMLEEQSRRPLRDLMASAQQATAKRQIVEAGMPVEQITGRSYVNEPNIGIVEKVTGTRTPVDGGQPITFEQNSKLVEPFSLATNKPFRSETVFIPDQKNPGLGTAVFVNPQTGEQTGKTEGVLLPQSYVPEPPKPRYSKGEDVVIPTPGGGSASVATRIDNITGQREAYDSKSSSWIPWLGAERPPSGGSKDNSFTEKAIKYAAYQNAEIAAGRTPVDIYTWMANSESPTEQRNPLVGAPAVSKEPEVKRVRLDGASIYGTP